VSGKGATRRIPLIELPMTDFPAASTSSDFRAGLGDALLALGYDYWRAKCAGRSMPRRRDIDPAEIPSLLPHILITEMLEEGTRYRYRLAGSAVTEAFGRSLTGRYVDEIMTGQYRAFITRLYRSLYLDRRCIFCESRRYTNGVRQGRSTKRLFMPLSNDDRVVDQALIVQTFQYAGGDHDIVIVDNMDEFANANIELVEPRDAVQP
jgi:hypothetical protein